MAEDRTGPTGPLHFFPSVTFLKRLPFFPAMARDDKIRMPASTAGITQYWDEVKTKIELKPQHVIVLAVIVVIAELLLQVYGHLLFG